MIGPAAGLLVMASLAAVPAAPMAHAEPETVSLSDVLHLLRESSPRTQADRSVVTVASAEVTAARVLPNPAFDYSGSRLTGGTNTGAADTNQLSLSQPLLLFGQRSRRLHQAELGVDVARSHAEQSLAERSHQARDRFASLQASQERVRMLEESLEDLQQVAKVVEGRASAGDRSHYDVLRIQLEVRLMEATLSSARADLEDTSGSLAALVGRPGWHPRAAGSLQAGNMDISDTEDLWRRALEARPDLVSARREQAAALDAITLARRERLPVPVLTGGALLTSDASSDSVIAGLTIPLPVFDHGQGEIARATARADAADLELEASTAEARSDLERAVAVLRQRRETLQQLETDVVSHLPEMRQMAETAYREGQADILEMLDALRSHASAKLVHLDALETVVHAENDLAAQLGATAAD